MITDANLTFSNNQAIVSTVASTNAPDLTGNPLAGLNTGNAATFGAEMGVGDGPGNPKILVSVGTTFTSGGSPTLQCQFQGSTDNSTWTTYVEQPATGIALASLVAGARVWLLDYPVRLLGASLPRYIRLNYVVANATYTAGTLNAFIVLQADAWESRNYASNFVVSA